MICMKQILMEHQIFRLVHQILAASIHDFRRFYEILGNNSV